MMTYDMKEYIGKRKKCGPLRQISVFLSSFKGILGHFSNLFFAISGIQASFLQEGSLISEGRMLV